MSGRREARAGHAGDRAVAIAGFLAILLTGFFGAEPEVAGSATQAAASAQHGRR